MVVLRESDSSRLVIRHTDFSDAPPEPIRHRSLWLWLWQSAGRRSAVPAADTDDLRRLPGHGREGIDSATEQPEILKVVKPST
jgi:anti-sigma factor ChrR (cupin superfamily)